jgi:hypothetical protein
MHWKKQQLIMESNDSIGNLKQNEEMEVLGGVS